MESLNWVYYAVHVTQDAILRISGENPKFQGQPVLSIWLLDQARPSVL